MQKPVSATDAIQRVATQAVSDKLPNRSACGRRGRVETPCAGYKLASFAAHMRTTWVVVQAAFLMANAKVTGDERSEESK